MVDWHALASLFHWLVGLMVPVAVGAIVGWQARKDHERRKRKHVVSDKLIMDLSTRDEAPEIEKEEFFRIDGETYYIAKECPPYLAMYYLNQLRDGSSERATLKVMDELVSRKAVQALAKCKTMKPEQLAHIISVIQEKIYDVMEKTTGN